MFIKYKTIIITCILTLCIFVIQGVPQQKQEVQEKPQNLKVLSKKISSDDLHKLMKEYAKSLGVKCGHCHMQRKDDPTKLDFVSDEKKEKQTARKMISMTADINKKFIAKIGNNGFEKIACVTCHMGRTKPIISVDSLAKN